jgi:HK97 family phage major capsid protein
MPTKDADGRPIWQPSLAVGAPSTINGYPVITDPAMPVMAASARSIAFGNWSEAYVIRDVLGFAVKRLNERYAEFDQTGFVGFTRTDGQVQQALAYRVLTNSAT